MELVGFYGLLFFSSFSQSSSVTSKSLFFWSSPQKVPNFCLRLLFVFSNLFCTILISMTCLIRCEKKKRQGDNEEEEIQYRYELNFLVMRQCVTWRRHIKTWAITSTCSHHHFESKPIWMRACKRASRQRPFRYTLSLSVSLSLCEQMRICMRKECYCVWDVSVWMNSRIENVDSNSSFQALGN